MTGHVKPAVDVRVTTVEPADVDAQSQLRHDLELLQYTERRPGSAAGPSFRTWKCSEPTVVVGRGSEIDSEVNVAYCLANSIPVVRRSSGGSAVLIGPGTLQYTFILPHDGAALLNTIGGCKSFCNEILLECMDGSGRLAADSSGDLVCGGLKVAGLALKRTRRASLLHGSILMSMELSLLSCVLKHPPREPAYRRGRPHEQFVCNWGYIDAYSLEREITARLGVRNV
jgi:lipoate-protein ligase A